ncbi:hypothetical protein C8R45DRAFT_910328 [Mycena sanguinolenta]|nr:hypothetical protein C8R45DRAFT_910328 [Mycena sanguinolenta]
MKEHFLGVVEVDEFLNRYMSRDDDSSTITEIVTKAADSLAAAKGIENAEDEKVTSQPLINYLRQVVSQFSDSNKPFIDDTHSTVFQSIQDNEHYTMPDIAISRPGLKTKATSWPEAGSVIELKHKTDIFNEKGQINDSEESSNALTQIAKSARSLLISSRSCHVYVVACFKRGKARILRFDRAGFRATADFNWLKEPNVFPTFLHRLYNPPSGFRMDGDDDTISIPSSREKTDMFQSLLQHDFYNKAEEFSEKDATKNSVWIKAVRFVDGADGKRVAEPVDCFTIGDDLSLADGLFGRATRVYRVILKQDMDKDKPTVYALKDSWRQSCRRPEVNFYDAIAKHCERQGIDMDKEGMPRCHGSIDLLVDPISGVKGWNSDLHVTRSAQNYERHHTRTLLTPVGKPLKSFDCTKSLVHALHNAIRHHQIASAAGVLHRDVSEGNILFREVPVAGEKLNGFLLDWDYAEFTEGGLKYFEAEFPDRAMTSEYKLPDKSLREFTGTFPFVAIEMIGISNKIHAEHHDLESFYWLLIWMILRHTEHQHSDLKYACTNLFDSPGPAVQKRGWLLTEEQFSQDLPISKFAEAFRQLVLFQHLPISRKILTYDQVRELFDEHLKSDRWPTNDKALPYFVPSADASKNETKSKGGSRLTGVDRPTRSGTAKRRRPDAGPDAAYPVASTSSAGTTAVASDGTEGRRSKKMKESNGQAE